MQATTFAPRPAVASLFLAGLAPWCWAFDSGSTGADGALTPTVNTEVVLPPSGILNYTSITIPSGVTVTFRPNVTNTPVVLLVSGNATISGVLSVSGRNSANSGTAGDGVLADDGTPGAGGPGGYAGGRGGRPGGALTVPDRSGGKGLGPGGGGGGLYCPGTDENGGGGSSYPAAGGGAGYGSVGAIGGNPSSNCPGYASAGVLYGAPELLPLIGGSGGGGGRTKGNWYASGGGGGGGALLLAVSGTLTVTNTTGRILAAGGTAGNVAGTGCAVTDYSSAGGGGSGGAIRLMATTLTGNGEISALGGTRGTATCGNEGGNAGFGRIRLEADTITRTTGTNPASTSGIPGPIFIAGLPSLKITTVAGTPVPDPPTGTADVSLPEATPNPVTVAFATTGIPVGNTVRLSVTPNSGAEVTAVSTALTGSTASATASASINLPLGGSTLQASITYTVIIALGESLSRFAGNERVDRITVTAGLDGRSTTKLITVSGREFLAPPEALRIAAMGG